MRITNAPPIARAAQAGMNHARWACEFRAEGNKTLASYHEREVRLWANWVIKAAELAS